MPENTRDDLVVSTPRSRLARVLDDPGTPEEPITFEYIPSQLARFRGVSNPFGSGIDAYEPNNEIFDEYQKSYDRFTADRDQEAFDQAIKTASSSTYIFGAAAGTDPINGSGKVADFVNAALGAAQRGIPYVWGGTNLSAGVDCSGLIYAAARAAGLNIPRYRAVDYARLGTEVPLAQARPGDIVYYDNPNTTTDHVGIYLGNGRVVQAPYSGQTVQVTSVGGFTSIRRIFTDDLMGTIATPGGGTATSYNGGAFDPTAPGFDLTTLPSPMGFAGPPTPGSAPAQRTHGVLGGSSRPI